jgi:hypothetical protein
MKRLERKKLPNLHGHRLMFIEVATVAKEKIMYCEWAFIVYYAPAILANPD